MLGRVRAPSSSPDTLQRPPSKLLKDDPFSIYEATLMKLKLGSQRSLDQLMETQSNCGDVNGLGDAATIELVHKPVDEEAVTMDTNCSSLTSDSILTSQSNTTKHFSVIYMFSEYNNSRNGFVSSCEEIMREDDNGFASACSSCSECFSDGSTKERCQHESSSPSSVSHL